MGADNACQPLRGFARFKNRSWVKCSARSGQGGSLDSWSLLHLHFLGIGAPPTFPGEEVSLWTRREMPEGLGLCPQPRAASYLRPLLQRSPWPGPGPVLSGLRSITGLTGARPLATCPRPGLPPVTRSSRPGPSKSALGKRPHRAPAARGCPLCGPQPSAPSRALCPAPEICWHPGQPGMCACVWVCVRVHVCVPTLGSRSQHPSSVSPTSTLSAPVPPHFKAGEPEHGRVRGPAPQAGAPGALWGRPLPSWAQAPLVYTPPGWAVALPS